MIPAIFSACSLGYLFPVRATVALKVHSVFQHALNLRSEEGMFLTLLCAKRYQNLADAARVVLPERWDWRQEVAYSAPVYLTGGILQTPRFYVGLNNAAVWQPEIQRRHLDTEAKSRSQQHYPILDSQLQQFCQKHKIESALQWRESAIRQGLRPQESPEQLEQQVPQLIGYGKGLTPDGDDYLLGYMAALWPWDLPPDLEAHLNRLHQLIERRLFRTTDISQHYLKRAVQGHFSQPICELLKQLNANAALKTIIACAENVMQFGATSGVDCLAGLLHGLRTLNAHS